MGKVLCKSEDDIAEFIKDNPMRARFLEEMSKKLNDIGILNNWDVKTYVPWKIGMDNWFRSIEYRELHFVEDVEIIYEVHKYLGAITIHVRINDITERTVKVFHYNIIP